MTFFDAAVEVLRQAGRALHYKKITEMAVEQGLLSHVGRTPHATMDARLGQEADKDAGARVRRVRPGVYVLARDVDRDQVSETERVAPAGAADEESNGEAAEARPRRRRRRGPLVAGPLDDADTASPRPPRTPSSRAPKPAAAGRPDEDVRVSRSLGLAEAVSEALGQAQVPMMASELADLLSTEPDDTVSPLVLEQVIHGLNRRRIREGKYPLFTRIEAGWVLTHGEQESDLLEACQSLERAHQRLIQAAAGAMIRSVQTLRGRQLDAFVRATLEGLGFETTALDSAPDDDRLRQLVIAAQSSEGLVPITALVSIWHAETPVNGDAVAALRGRLLRFGATHGVIVSVRRGGIDADARAEAASLAHGQPIALYDAKTLAPLALEARVGVVTYPIDVPLIDASWFRNGA